MQTAAEIFLEHLHEFHRLALALCGDYGNAEQAILNAHERATDTHYVRPGWHLCWMKHCIIQSCLEVMRAAKVEQRGRDGATPRWSDLLSAPFHSPLPRAVFVLRIWEGLSVVDVSRYCSLSQGRVQAILLEIWQEIRLRPSSVSEFVAALVAAQRQRGREVRTNEQVIELKMVQ